MTRSPQNPDSSLQKVTRSIKPVTPSVAGASRAGAGAGSTLATARHSR